MKNNSPVCVIIGAGDYIGGAIARRFATGGFIVCLGRRNGEKNDALVAEIEAAGGQAHSYTLDAASPESRCLDPGDGRQTLRREILNFAQFTLGTNLRVELKYDN